MKKQRCRCDSDPNFGNLYFPVGRGLHQYELVGQAQRYSFIYAICKNCDRKGHHSSHCDQMQLEQRCTYCTQAKHNAENCKWRKLALDILYDRGFVREPIDPKDQLALASGLPDGFVPKSPRGVLFDQRTDFRNYYVGQPSEMDHSSTFERLPLPAVDQCLATNERDWDEVNAEVAQQQRELDAALNVKSLVQPEPSNSARVEPIQPASFSDVMPSTSTGLHTTSQSDAMSIGSSVATLRRRYSSTDSDVATQFSDLSSKRLLLMLDDVAKTPDSNDENASDIGNAGVYI